MELRRLGSALAAVAIVTAFAVALPSAANAASYPTPPTPVGSLPATPDEFAALTTPDKIMARWWQQISGGRLALAGSGANQVLTKMTPVARGNTVLLAGSAAFLATAGAVKLVYAATGTSFNKDFCSLPTWAQDGYTVFSAGIYSGTCSQPVVDPNGEQPANYGTVNYGTYSATYIKTVNGGTTNPSAYCYNVTGTVPVGYFAVTQSTTGLNWGPPVHQTGFGCGVPDMAVRMQAGGYTGAVNPAVHILSTSTGNEVAAMTVSRPNPTRNYRCQQVGDGGFTGVSAKVIQGNEAAGLTLNSFQTSCDGMHFDWSKPNSKVQIAEQDPSTGNWTPVISSDLPEGGRLEMQNNPTCYDGSQTCVLTLQAVKGGQIRNCMTGDPTACATWWTDTASGTTPTTSDGWQYQCRYGAEVVSLGRCAVYQTSFQPSTLPGTGTQPNPSTDPSGAPLPSTGTTASPNTIQPQDQVGTPGGNCMATWFDSANPIDWVLTPVKCALVWAFVPRTQVLTAMQTSLTATATTTGVKPMFDGLTSLPAAFFGTSGCGGLPFHLQGQGWVFNSTLFAACTEPMAGVAATVRGIMSVVISLGAFLAIMRYAAALFGFVAFGQRVDADTDGRNADWRSGG